ncbi:MAG: glycosyltransferase family 2 protein [Candidatus Auribacterota bacterium]
MSIKVSIIIINYNTVDLLKKCLSSIKQYCTRDDTEIIVVDNNSHDNSVAMVQSEFPDVVLIASKTNLGFVKGNNLAAKQAKGQYVLLLNSDTELTEDGIDGIIDFMDKTPDAGVIGGKILFPNKTLQLSCRRFSLYLSEFINQTTGLVKGINPFASYIKMKHLDYGKSHIIDWVSGAYMLIRKDLINEIGLFDDEIFMFCEDMDLCKRVYNHGYSVYYFPGSTIIHYHGATAKKNPSRSIFYSFWSSSIYFRKHRGTRSAAFYKRTVFITWHLLKAFLILLGYISKSSKIKEKKLLFTDLISFYKHATHAAGDNK